MESVPSAMLIAALMVLTLGESRGVGLHLAQEPSAMPKRLSIGDSSLAFDDFSDLTSCRVTTGIFLLKKGDGRGAASTSVSCEAKREAVHSVTEKVSEFMSGLGSNPDMYCTRDAVVTLAESISNAVGSAYTLARLQFEIDGNGVECADLSAEADSYATAFAKAVLRDVVESKRLNSTKNATNRGTGISRRPLCLATSLRVVFVKAWAETKAVGCVAGTGSFVDEQISFSKSVQNAIARVLLELVKRPCRRGRQGRKELKALMEELEANKSYQVDTKAALISVREFSKGVAQASGGSLLQCDGKTSSQCCSSDTSGCTLRRKNGFVVHKGAKDACCCVEGLLPYFVL